VPSGLVDGDEVRGVVPVEKHDRLAQRGAVWDGHGFDGDVTCAGSNAGLECTDQVTVGDDRDRAPLTRTAWTRWCESSRATSVSGASPSQVSGVLLRQSLTRACSRGCEMRSSMSHSIGDAGLGRHQGLAPWLVR